MKQNSKEKPQVQCPNCKSFKTTSSKMLTFILGAMSVGCLGPMFLIIFFPLGILAVLIGFIFMCMSPFVKNKNYLCQSCNHRFKLEEK